MKKFLSLVLALSMVFSLLVLPAKADESVSVSVDTNQLLKGASVKLTGKCDNAAKDKLVYQFTYDLGSKSGVSIKKTTATAKASYSYSWTPSAAGEYTVYCTVYKGSEVLGSDSVEITVVDGSKIAISASKTSLSAKAGDTFNILDKASVRLYATDAIPALNLAKNETIDADFTFSSSDKTVAAVDADGDVTVKGDGSVTITVSASFMGKKFTKDVKLTCKATTYTLGSVVNGSSKTYSASTIQSAIVSAIKSSDDSKFTKDKIESITLAELPDRADLYKTKVSSSNRLDEGDNLEDLSLCVDTEAGYIGTDTIKVDVVTSTASDYTVTLKIPVVGDEKIAETVSGVAAKKDVSYKVSSTYPGGLYVYTGTTTFKDTDFNGFWEDDGNSGGSDWDYYAKGKSFTVKASAFSSGKAVVHVVGLDSKGVASTGTITFTTTSASGVTEADGDIVYKGSAGSTVTFDQDDFETFMKKEAYDEDMIPSKTSSLIEFEYLVFDDIPDEDDAVLKNGTKTVTGKTRCTDMDDVSIDLDKSVKGALSLDFTIYATVYESTKDNEGEEYECYGSLGISVVNSSGDIKYNVSAGETVTFKADDFLTFFRKEFPKGTLEYVTFDKLPNSLDGTLYSYYGTQLSTAAKTTVDYYYSTSSTRDYALGDVTYKASTWAKDGSKVNLPFTAYGSYDGGDATLCGYVVISVTKAMNFTDVPRFDASGAKTWYYDNVAKAYSLGLIAGKTTTTFCPDDNMTYAEAVTLACRIHQLDRSGVVTLQNGTNVWYSTYMTYALQNGIISSDLSPVADMPITRKAYVDIFYAALPASSYPAINTVTSIPDVANTSANARIYTFYRAGILTGYTQTPGKAEGSFGPQDTIKRSEVATILLRMVEPSTRVTFKK